MRTALVYAAAVIAFAFWYLSARTAGAPPWFARHMARSFANRELQKVSA